MKYIKKMLLGFLCTATLLSGCSTSSSVSYTYNVDTGNKVKITVETSDGYHMSPENPFIISKGDTELLTGQFLTVEGYTFYDKILTDENLESQQGKIIEKGTKGTSEYVFYSIRSETQTENNFFVKINDKTSVIIGSLASEIEAKTCFDKINFEILK